MVNSSGLLGVFVIVVLALFQSIPSVPAATDNHCPSSSRGKIHEIKLPFRLRGDPEGCGDPRYELVCQDNNNLTTLTLSLSLAEYHVQSINYNNYTIRLVDPAIQLQHQDSNFRCASIPRYNLYPHNFSFCYYDKYPYSLYEYAQNSPCFDYFRKDINRMVIFWNCPRRVTDGLPANTTLCSESDGENSGVRIRIHRSLLK